MKTKLVSYDEYEIISGEDVELSLSEIFELIDQFSWNKSSYITFPINEINLFQLLFEDTDKFIVEITTDSTDMVFYQKYASFKEVKGLIQYFFENKDVTKETLFGFYKVPICSKTLDEVIEESNKKQYEKQ